MLSLKDALSLFYLDRESFVAESSIKDYKRMLKYFEDYMCDVRGCPADDIPISSLTVDDVRLYQLSLRERKKNQAHPYKPVSDTALSKATIRTYMIHLKAFLNFCINEEYCDQRVLRNFRMIKAEKKVKLPLTADEVDDIDGCFSMNTFTG